MLTTELAAWDGVGMVSRNGSGEPLGADELTEGLMPQVTCGLCGIRETIGSAKAGRMLSCQACKKQYHRKCIKQWADYRGKKKNLNRSAFTLTICTDIGRWHWLTQSGFWFGKIACLWLR
jgi:hypothetical protein